MELIYTYINNYKGLYDLALPTSSKYKVSGNRNHIKIIQEGFKQRLLQRYTMHINLRKKRRGKTSN